MPADPSSPTAQVKLLTPLLERVFPTPVSFFSQSSAASANDIVPLCLHCLMIEAGCTPLASKKNRPPANWNKHQDEWVVEYRHEKDGVSTRFRLHCSLQQRSGRLFVHAEELTAEKTEDVHVSEKNIQVLGLQLSNYTKIVPEDVKGDAWSDYVKNERTLKEMFRQFIVKPLLETSGRKALDGLREQGGAYDEVEKVEVGARGCDAKREPVEAPLMEGPGNSEAAVETMDAAPQPEPEAAQKEKEPELFSPETSYANLYSTSDSYSGYSTTTTSMVLLAAAVGACVLGYWAFSRPRKTYTLY